MRELPCPHCEHPIRFSWADFVFLNNWGKSDLFCLGCKKSCTINNAATVASFAASLLPVVTLYILIFVSGIFSLPEYSKAIYLICSIPVVMLLRAFATARFAELVVE